MDRLVKSAQALYGECADLCRMWGSIIHVARCSAATQKQWLQSFGSLGIDYAVYECLSLSKRARPFVRIESHRRSN